MAIEEVDRANPLELIFVPDEWMQEQHLSDNAFDDAGEQVAEVTGLNKNEPVQLKRNKRPYR